MFDGMGTSFVIFGVILMIVGALFFKLVGWLWSIGGGWSQLGALVLGGVIVGVIWLAKEAG